MGNQRGRKLVPTEGIPLAQLEPLVTAGLKLSVIAKRLKTSEYFVRRNMEHYGLAKTCELPYKMQHTDLEYLERMGTFSPGITEKARNFYSEPNVYVHALYEAFAKVMELLWFIKDQAQHRDYYLERSKIHKDHVCFSPNRWELVFSIALLDAGMPHQREVRFGKGYNCDFLFPEHKLMVELDGEWHKKDTKTIERDKRKTAEALALGYRVMRSSTKQLKQDSSEVVQQIRAALALAA